MSDVDASKPWGVLAEFASADALLAAARDARDAGFDSLEAYAPFAVDGLDDALALPKPRVAAATFVGGLLGGIGAYALQWYAAVVDYPINVGGRPLHSWPMFIPVTFEVAVLCAAFAAVFAFLFGSRLPALHHPIFAAPEFDLATRNRFFLVVRSDSARFDAPRAERLLGSLAPIRISRVEAT